MLLGIKNMVESVDGTPMGKVLDILCSQKFIEPEESINERELPLEVLPDYEKALYTCVTASLEVFEALERQLVFIEVSEQKKDILRKKSIASEEVGFYFFVLHFEWKKRFPQFDTHDLAVRKDFLLVKTNPQKTK